MIKNLKFLFAALLLFATFSVVNAQVTAIVPTYTYVDNGTSLDVTISIAYDDGTNIEWIDGIAVSVDLTNWVTDGNFPAGNSGFGDASPYEAIVNLPYPAGYVQGDPVQIYVDWVSDGYPDDTVESGTADEFATCAGGCIPAGATCACGGSFEVLVDVSLHVSTIMVGGNYGDVEGALEGDGEPSLTVAGACILDGSASLGDNVESFVNLDFPIITGQEAVCAASCSEGLPAVFSYNASVLFDTWEEDSDSFNGCGSLCEYNTCGALGNNDDENLFGATLGTGINTWPVNGATGANSYFIDLPDQTFTLSDNGTITFGGIWVEITENVCNSSGSCATSSANVYISDPCVCINNAAANAGVGQFSETVTVQGSTTGTVWTVVSASGAYEAPALLDGTQAGTVALAAGTVLVDNGDGTFDISFVHNDAVGYVISVTDGTNVLSISNTCNYPEAAIVGIPQNLCTTDLDIYLLEGSPTGGTFTIDGVAATTLDPATFAAGDNALIEYTYTNPGGCDVTVSQNVWFYNCCSDFSITDFTISSSNICENELLAFEVTATSNLIGSTVSYFLMTEEEFATTFTGAAPFIGVGSLLGSSVLDDVFGAAQGFLVDVDVAQDIVGCDPSSFVLVAIVDPATYPAGLDATGACIIVGQTNLTVWPDLSDVTIAQATMNCVTTLTPSCAGVTLSTYAVSKDPLDAASDVTVTVSQAGNPCTFDVVVSTPACGVCPDPEFKNVQNPVCASDPDYMIGLSEVVTGGGFLVEGPGAMTPAETGVIVDNGDGTLTVSPTTAQNDYIGVYTITYTAPVVAGNGCAPVNISESFTIHGSYDACFTAPAPFICLGSETYTATANDGPADGSTHEWYLNGVMVGTGTSYTFTPSSAGAFLLEHNVGVDICQTQCAVTINVVDGAAIANTELLPDNVVCQGTNNCLVDLTQYLNPGPSLNGGTFQLLWNRPMINEVEYSNVTDRNDVSGPRDYVEIAGAAGTDLSDYLIVLYEAKQNVTDNIGEGNGRVYAVLSPALGYGWYIDYNDETGVEPPMMSDPSEACDNCLVPDLAHGCGDPLKFDNSPNQWCTSPDIIRPLDGDCEPCNAPGRWDSDVFPLFMLNRGATTASTIIPGQLTAANGVDYGALAIELGTGRNQCTPGGDTHGGDIQAGPAGIALVYVGDDFAEATPQEEAMLPLYGDHSLTAGVEPQGPSACEFDYQVIQFVGYGTCFSATQPHDPSNPIANGDASSYFPSNDVNTDGNDYNIDDPADEPWFEDDFNGNVADHAGLYTNKGIFSACNGPARGLITTDINVCDMSSTGSVQFTNDCWVIPNVTDSEINYPSSDCVGGGPGVELFSPGWLNWAQLGNTQTSFTNCTGSSSEEFYYDFIAPNGDILNMCNLCPTLFVGGLAVQEDEALTYGPGTGGDLDSDDENDILFDFRKNQVYPVCFSYTFPGMPQQSECAPEADSDLCIYIMSQEQNFWEGPRFLCEGMSTPVNLNTLLMDSIQFVGPHKLWGSVEATIEKEFTENMKAPIITEVNYVYHDIQDDLGGGDVTTDNHCISYNYVPTSVGTPNSADDYHTRYICEGIEISGEAGTELSCYALVFYHNSTVYGDNSPANGAAQDVIYLGADGLLHATNINEGQYMQLYGTIDTDCGPNPNRDLFTVPGLLDWGTTTFTDEGVTQNIPNGQSFADTHMSEFFGTPWYYGATYTGNANNFGNNFGGANANIPAVGGLFWDNNNNHAYDSSDDLADPLDFPWERRSECQGQCGVGSRWFPIADVPGGSMDEIGGVGIMNTCTGELLDFISWGSDVPLCNVAYEDDSYGGPFEQLTSTPIDTTQDAYSTDDLRTLQFWSCSLLSESTQANACVAEKCANDGGVWVMVFDGGNAMIPGCFDVPQLGGNTEFSNSIGYYNCTLDPDATKCVAPDALTLPLGDLSQLVEDGGSYQITELDNALSANTGTIPSNYIVTDHEMEVTISGPSGDKVIRYTVGSDLCSITGRPTDFDTWTNTNDISVFWENSVEPMDYMQLNENLQGSYQTPPVFLYDPLDYYSAPLNQGYIGGTDDEPYGNVACMDDNDFINANYSNNCLNGEFWGGGNPNFQSPNNLFFGYDNGYQVAPAAGTDNNLNDGGCYEGYCTTLAQTNYWVKDLCAYIFNGNRRIPVAGSAGDTCFTLDRTPQTYTVSITMRMTYEQCFPIGDFYGPGVTVNMDNMDDPFWQLDPSGLSDESPLEITFNASNFNDLDTDEASDDINCSNPSTQLVPVNFSYPADLVDDITVCSTDDIILVTLLAPGTPANGQFTCADCPSGALPSNFFFNPEASGPGSFTLHYATNIGTDCFTEDEIVINVLGNLNMDVDCNGDSYDITASGYPADANLTGIWVGGVNYGPGPTITVDAPAVTTDVDVTYDFDGCQVVETVTLYPSVNLTAIQIGCTDGDFGGSVNLFVNGGIVNVANGYHYTVNGGASMALSSPVVSGLNPGLNTICLSANGSGCEDCFDLVVAPVTAEPSVETSSVCVGETVIVTATHEDPTATFNWSLNGSTIVSTNDFFTFTNIQNAQTVLVNATVGTCQSQYVAVTVTPIAPVNVIAVDSECIEGSIQSLVTVVLAGTGPFVSSGSGSFSGNVYTEIVSNGNHSWTFNTVAADIAGCDGETVSLTTNCELPPLNADPDDLDEHSAGDIVIFNGGNLLPNDEGSGISVVSVYECDGGTYTTLGTVSNNGNGSWTYTPPSETFVGNDTLCYTIEDEFGQIDDTYVVISYVDVVACDFVLTVNTVCDETLPQYSLIVTVSQGPANAVYELWTGTGDPISGLQADGSGLLVYQLGPFESDGNNGYSIQINSLSGGCSQSSSLPLVECIKTSIDLLTFSGEVLSEGNLISWTTSSETENDYFTVERSKDGISNWSEVLTVDGAGNSSLAINYAKLDASAPNGTSFYRLKETNFQGVTRVASDVISLTRGVQSYSFTNVYPVPTSDVVNVRFASVKETSVTVKVYDIAGKLVTTKNVVAQASSDNSFSLDIRGYAAGTYYMSLTDGEVTINTKIIKD